MEAMMASAIESGMVLWMWPLTAVRLASDWVETMTIARTVIDARMPMIAAAWTNPFTANHSELTRMVTEKKRARWERRRKQSPPPRKPSAVRVRPMHERSAG